MPIQKGTKDNTEKKKEKISEYSRVISNEELMIYSNAPFKANIEKATFGYVMISNGCIVDAGAYQRTKVASSKEAKTSEILVTLEKAKVKRLLQDACDV